MPVDSAEKRLSIMDMDEMLPGIPAPTGAFDTVEERQHLLWLYSGISAGGGGGSPPGFDAQLVMARRRNRR